VPENCDQGIFFNGSAKKRIVAVFIQLAVLAETSLVIESELPVPLEG